MQIQYCERCGMRVSEKALADGQAIKIGEKVFCAGCVPARPKSSATSMPAAGMRAHAGKESSAKIAAARANASARGGVSRKGAAEEAPKNNTVLIVVAVAVPVVLVLVYLLFASGDRTPVPARVSSGHDKALDESHAQTTFERPATPKVEVKSTVPQDAARTLPGPAKSSEAPSTTSTKEADAEKLASDALDVLLRFEGLAAADKEGKIKRIDEYLAKHGDTIVAARARRLMNELKEAAKPVEVVEAPKPVEAPQPVEAPKPADPAKTVETTPQPKPPEVPTPGPVPDVNGAAKQVSLDLGGGVKMEFALVPPGEFEMGDAASKPAHKVKLTRAFYMGKYPVTQAQYEKTAGRNPSQFKGENLPVESVDYNDATEFCKKATALFKKTFRLPTEAEWEYACRAGTQTTFYSGPADADLDQAAWFAKNSEGKTHPVGLKKPNAWGLYDMHGNVFQWCQDWFGDDYYQKAPAEDPQGPEQGSTRSMRGGCWSSDPWICRSARRFGDTPQNKDNFIGFRVVLVPSAKTP